LKSWWSLQTEQAAADGLSLDLPRLQELIEPADPGSLGELPVLLLFDGIDEIGGNKVRQRLLDIAHRAAVSGYRVLVTGRPAGYKDLNETVINERNLLQPLRLYHLLPFAWPQIEQFITAWYTLRDEWKVRKQAGISRFLQHLGDSSRRHLLVLARRPIFLTLMALVHCTQNEMPEGRPLLYRRIIDLYLDRQERHRQRRRTTEDRPMPHWPGSEMRSVLAHLAWQSQVQGSENDSQIDPDSRRVTWNRKQVEIMIRRQLIAGPGRFAVLKPENVGEIVDYFLHPAGLLVEPAEGMLQFAHLSFQEYLCSWFLHERGKIAGLKPYLEKELYPRLARPGWDEVGILLLSIHAEDTGNEGHFEMLSWLDVSQAAQANLYVEALTGRELPFTTAERLAKLPLAVALCLTHPEWQFGDALSRIPEWTEEGRRLVLRLLEAGDPQRIRGVLEQEEVLGSISLEPQDSSLIQLINTTRWSRQDDPFAPIDSRTEESITRWLASKSGIADLLWKRDSMDIAVPSALSRELGVLLPARGELFRLVSSHLPVDACLLQGEASQGTQPVVLFSLNPQQEVGPRGRLALALYEVRSLVEGSAEGRVLYQWSRSISQLLSKSLSASLLKFLTRPHSQPLPPSWSRSLTRSLALHNSRSESLPWVQSRLQSRLLSVYISLSDSQSQTVASSLIISLFQSLSQKLSLTSETRSVVESLLGRLNNWDKAENFLSALAWLGLRYAAFDWFEEQAVNPELTKRRGLRLGEPLPRDFGLLDERGCPFPVQRRSSWLRLRDWLADDAEVLQFVFPEGLSTEDRQLLIADMIQLRKQPWSPQAAVDMVLKNWPVEQKHREITLEVAEQNLLKQAKALLHRIEKSERGS
jgi:hypothetical protein